MCSKISTGSGQRKRRAQHAACVVERRRRDDPQTRNVRVPALEAVRVLGGQLPARAGGHADDERHRTLPSRHVAERGGVVDDLIERQQAEVDRHDFDDRPQAAERRADPGADECGLGQAACRGCAPRRIPQAATWSPHSSHRSGRHPRPSERRAGRCAAHRAGPRAMPRDRSCAASEPRRPSCWPLRVDKALEFIDGFPLGALGECHCRVDFGVGFLLQLQEILLADETLPLCSAS